MLYPHDGGRRLIEIPDIVAILCIKYNIRLVIEICRPEIECYIEQRINGVTRLLYFEKGFEHNDENIRRLYSLIPNLPFERNITMNDEHDEICLETLEERKFEIFPGTKYVVFWQHLQDSSCGVNHFKTKEAFETWYNHNYFPAGPLHIIGMFEIVKPLELEEYKQYRIKD